VLSRLFSFFVFQLMGCALGWGFVHSFVPAGEGVIIGCLSGAVIAGYFWQVFDLSQGLGVLRWLRTGDASHKGVQFGLWGEVSDRISRLIRTSERTLQQHDSRLQEFLAAMQASPNGVVLLDADVRIEWFNQSAGQHFGLDSERDLQQHFGNLVRDPGFAEYLAAADFRHDVLMPGRANTETKPVRLSVHIHPYGDGRSLLLSRDVTALEQAEAMRRDFVANVSHEIRTPLTVLGGFVETLQTLPLDDEERRRYLDLMAQQAYRMQSLVSDLLTLSRLEGSPLPSDNEWVGADSILNQCRQEAQELSRILWSQSQHILFDSDADVLLAGSTLELHSAMFNLIGNAVRYTPPDKAIRVALQMQADGGVIFSVRDEGVGIAAEHLPRVTERFYRVDRSRSRDTGGTGLGLAIVKHVAQRHGGELSISSVLGAGSTFTVRFPPGRVKRRDPGV